MGTHGYYTTNQSSLRRRNRLLGGGDDGVGAGEASAIQGHPVRGQAETLCGLSDRAGDVVVVALIG